jgi:hypothetical protein
MRPEGGKAAAFSGMVARVLGTRVERARRA